MRADRVGRTGSRAVAAVSAAVLLVVAGMVAVAPPSGAVNPPVFAAQPSDQVLAPGATIAIGASMANGAAAMVLQRSTDHGVTFVPTQNCPASDSCGFND